jgi:trimethylamine:corrinoid methyltransferase-like protein
MEMFDQAMPGAVLRIYYEHLVEDVENEVRRMLDSIGVPFDEACLRWYERKGAVRTPSSEQVRQPIYRSALEEWRNFDPWLDHAKSILSDELLRYPAG